MDLLSYIEDCIETIDIETWMTYGLFKTLGEWLAFICASVLEAVFYMFVKSTL